MIKMNNKQTLIDQKKFRKLGTKVLVIVAASFPYGNIGDAVFIKNEIPILKKMFSKIIVITTAQKEDNIIYNDSEIEIVHVNIHNKKILSILKSFITILSKKTIEELIFAKKIQKQKFFKMLKNMIKYEYMYNKIKGTLKKYDGTNTVYYSYWFSSRAYALAKIRDKLQSEEVITRAHGFDCFLANGYLPYRQLVLQKFEKVIFISKNGENDFKEKIYRKAHNPKAILQTSHLGVNIDEVGLNKQLCIKEFLHIVTCSRIVKIKRLDLLILALSKIENIQVKWDHFGDGEMSDEIKKFANSKLRSNIECIFHGNVSNDSIYDFYKNNAENIDFILNVSDLEGIPVAIMEAAKYRIPAIARNVGGIPEIVLKEFLIEPGENDKEAVDNIVSKILEYQKLTPMQKESLRKMAYNYFVSKFDLETNLKEIF